MVLLALTDGNPVIPFRENDVALYFQDDWKIRPDLTLNLGLRWEFFGQAVNVLHNETVARQTGSNPLWDPSLPLSVTTFQKVPNRWKNYQPRIGFAWNPNHSRLVVRGGYAINFDPAFYNIFENSAVEAPVANAGAINCGGGYQCLPASGTTGATVRAQNLAALPLGGDPRFDVEGPLLPNFRNPYTQTYSLGVQYGIGNAAVVEVRYVGNHTVGPLSGARRQSNSRTASLGVPQLCFSERPLPGPECSWIPDSELQCRSASGSGRQHRVLELQQPSDKCDHAYLPWLHRNGPVHLQPDDRQCQ